MAAIDHLRRELARRAGRAWYRWWGHRTPLDRPVLLLGAHRSGTTVLARLLSRHPDVAHWSEANDVWDPGYARKTLDPYFAGDAVHAYRRSGRDVTDSDRERILGTFGCYTWVARKRRFLNKSPFHCMRVEWLRQLFPDCRFVYIHRDGRAVAHSYRGKMLQHARTGRYAAPTRDDLVILRLAAETWIEVTNEMERVRRVTPASVWFDLTYERLCDDVHGSLREVFRFCELDPDRYDYATAPRTLENRNFKWQTTMTPQERALVASVLGERLRELGYRVDPHERFSG